MKSVFSNKSVNQKASFFGIIEASFYALVPLIFLLKFIEDPSLEQTLLSAIVLSSLKDALPLFYVSLLILIKKERREKFFSIFKDKKYIAVSIAGIFGGAIGYSLFNLSYYLAGPSYGHIFSSMQPILIALVAFIYWKRKFIWKVWLGIGITVFGTILLVFGLTFESKPHNTNNLILGSVFAILAVISWTLEALVADRILMKAKRNDILYILWMKMFASLLFNIIILFPIVSKINHDVSMGYKWIGRVFTNGNFLWRFFLAGSILFLGRFLFFETMRLKGSTFATIVYQLSIIFTPMFDLIYFWCTGNYIGNESDLSSRYQIIFWISTLTIFVGVMVTIHYSKNLIRL